MSAFDDFDPNSRPLHDWATYCVRSGAPFKIHAGRGQAINAVHHHDLAKMYKWVGGKWMLIAEKNSARAPKYCEACAAPLMIDYTDYAGRSRKKFIGNFIFGRDHNGKVAEKITTHWVCKGCAR